MISNILPSEATHSSLDLFKRQNLLSSFDSSFEQRIGPVYSANGPTVEFEVVGDRNNFIDLQKIFLALTCKITQINGAALRAHASDVALRDTPHFVNNILHSLFSEVEVSGNGIKISSSNSLYGHKAFIETEFSFGKDVKDTLLKCQGYSYETDPSDAGLQVITDRRALTAVSTPVTLFGKIAADIFTCDNLMLPNVTIRIKFVRAHNDFVVVSEDNAKHYKVEITAANLYVRKMTVNDQVLAAIERVLTKTPAMYSYTEVIPKTFIIPRGQNSWRHEDIFSREPIRRIAIAMNTNTAFAGSNHTNPFHYQKFGLRSVTLYRNGTPFAGTPLDTLDEKRIYCNSLSDLSFTDKGHGIPLDEYANHFVMVFDLTSTQEAAHDYIHPELTNATISLEFSFATQLTSAIEVLFVGEKSSIIYIDSKRKISKNTMIMN